VHKRASVTAELAALANELVGDLYERLERLRLQKALG
jgi:hypothetical protein